MERRIKSAQNCFPFGLQTIFTKFMRLSMKTSELNELNKTAKIHNYFAFIENEMNFRKIKQLNILILLIMIFMQNLF